MAQHNILVTGANGFIGRAFLKKLIQGPHHVSALAHHEDPQWTYPESIQEIIFQDITQSFSLDQDFDFVFHFSALNLTHVGKALYADYHKVNVQGTENLLKAVQSKNFIFMSTAKVYQQNQLTLDERSKVAPRDDYAKSKLAAEEICRKYFQGENLSIFRSVNIVGPGQAEKALLPILFRNALQNQPLEIFAPKDSRIQLLDIEDVVSAFELLIQKGGVNDVLNLAPEDSIAFADLAREIVKITESQSEINFSNFDHFPFCAVRSQKVKKILGWKACRTIQDILNRYCQFCKNP